MNRYSYDADGNSWEYRLKTLQLERRRLPSSVWCPVTGNDMLASTPEQLRHIADVIDGHRDNGTWACLRCTPFDALGDPRRHVLHRIGSPCPEGGTEVIGGGVR